MGTRARGSNPYTRSAAPPGGAAPQTVSEVWSGHPSYAVRQTPESSDPEYTTAFSPSLVPGGSATGVALPDDIRIGRREPPPNDFNDPEWNAVRTSEYHRRTSVEQHSRGGWPVQQRRPNRPYIPDQEQDKLPTRPTASMAPLSGAPTLRPWHIPRNLADIQPGATLHFSMASHRRNFEIMGMAPRGGVGVNSYRADLRPWSEDMYYPPRATDAGAQGIAGNATYRLE